MKYTASLIVVSLVLLGAACGKKTITQDTGRTQTPGQTNTNQAVNSSLAVSSVRWEFNGANWRATGTPPACPEPLLAISPVDVSKATSILYPGQTRGGDYKAHGGFRFDGKKNTDVTVTAPMDAVIDSASRYIESGEIQYLITFIHPCGMMYRFDHLLTLSPAMQAIADTLPAAKVDDSRTTFITSGASVKIGDTIATAVGFKQTSNVSVDFGLYDLRNKNAAAANAAYASSHSADQAQHAVCWLNLLPAADAAVVKALSGGDQTSGQTSDYCQ